MQVSTTHYTLSILTTNMNIIFVSVSANNSAKGWTSVVGLAQCLLQTFLVARLAENRVLKQATHSSRYRYLLEFVLEEF